MSIYRRTERFSPTDLRVDEEMRPSGASGGAGVPSKSGAQGASEEDWTKRRKSEPANGLLKPTFAWASTLPVEAQPRSLMYKFPRIANLLAAMWPDPNSFRRYIDDLLVDKRGNRQGFPVDVLKELFELRAYYDEIHPDGARPWESIKRNG
jgi:hypothetical protein